MKIGIDARWIFRELSGIGAYTLELIRHLVLMSGSDSLEDAEFVIYFSDPEIRDRTVAETGFDRHKIFSSRLLPYGLFSAGNQLFMPRMFLESALDVFHSPNYMIPFLAFPRNKRGRVRCVTTIHDLIPLMFPDFVPRSLKRRFFPLYRSLMRETAMRSDLILTDSSSARKDVIQNLPAPPERVLAIPLGVSEKFRPFGVEPAGRSERPAVSPPGRTILWVGRADPYKNLAGLVEAFAVLRQKCDFPVKLRLVGPEDRRYPEAGRLAASLGVEPGMVRLGYLPDEQLVREYQNADVFVQPSLYEGFGLPVLEAMACGTPVICTDSGSLPEVAGDAALTVSPGDTAGLADAMRRVLTDARLARQMSERGLRHAQKFNWKTTARRTVEAYRMAAS